MKSPRSGSPGLCGALQGHTCWLTQEGGPLPICGGHHVLGQGKVSPPIGSPFPGALALSPHSGQVRPSVACH